MINDRELMEQATRMLKMSGVLTENAEDIADKIKKGSLKTDWKYDLSRSDYSSTLEYGKVVKVEFRFTTDYKLSGRLRQPGKTKYRAYIEIRVDDNGKKSMETIEVGRVSGEHKEEAQDKLKDKMKKIAAGIGIHDVRFSH